MPEDVVDRIRASPTWPAFEGLAHTIPYDIAMVGGPSMPLDRLAAVRVPTLALAGTASPAWARNSVRALAAAVPHAKFLELDRQRHAVADDVVAPVLIDFLR